jgi:hypothetical protein
MEGWKTCTTRCFCIELTPISIGLLYTFHVISIWEVSSKSWVPHLPIFFSFFLFCNSYKKIIHCINIYLSLNLIIEQIFQWIIIKYDNAYFNPEKYANLSYYYRWLPLLVGRMEVGWWIESLIVALRICLSVQSLRVWSWISNGWSFLGEIMRFLHPRL